MGRKGVSKQKPKRAINKLLSKDNANAGNFPTGKSALTPLVSQAGSDQATNRKNSSDPRKKPKKR